MRNYVICGLVFALLLVFTGVSVTPVAAQDKEKKAKDKDTKKDKDKKDKTTGVIEVVESKDGKFRLTIRDTEGKYLASTSVGFATDKDARAHIAAIKEALENPKIEAKKTVEKEKGKEKGEKEKGEKAKEKGEKE